MKNLLLGILLSACASCCSGCGGGSPSDLQPYEIGLVGVYELNSFILDGELYDNNLTDGWAGELWLYDNNEAHRTFVFGYDVENVWSNWHATLTTLELEGQLNLWETSKPNGIGVDIGDILTIREPNGTEWFYQKIDMPPRN